MRMRRHFAVAVAMGTLGCTTASPPSQEQAAASAVQQQASPPPQAAIDKGNAAIGALQGRLLQRVTETMGQGGPTAAVTVCRDEAQALTAQVAAEQGITMGRTSHRLRNPNNAPREWVKPYVAQWAGKKASEVQPVVVDLGDKVGILRPIPTGAPCITCHGAPETLSPEVKATLQQAYPEDQAVGFSVGDLRGVFWAEVPR